MTTIPALPTPRVFLTSLLNTLFTTPLDSSHLQPHPPQSRSQQINPPYSYANANSTTNSNSISTNPLHSLPPSHPIRALLATLHVLFPPPMLLQALDLLDRELVTRVVLSPHSLVPEAEPGLGARNDGDKVEGLVGSVVPPQAGVHLLREPGKGGEGVGKLEEKGERRTEDAYSPGKSRRGAPDAERANTIYLVRSSQPTSRGKFGASTSSSSGIVYTVHLHAWNCTCAAFAFSAFPSIYPSSPSASSVPPWEEPFLAAESPMVANAVQQEEQEWEFGGLSLDGKAMETGGEERDAGIAKNAGGLKTPNAPICKHLLACLLGERWGAVLGGYVTERIVGMEEMAGLAAGG